MVKSQSLSTTEKTRRSAAPTATGVYICVHGHFYQPPRENPSLDTVSRQPSAEPFHDWNERILYESYRPNAFARVLNDRGEVIRIVNNYEHISFNIGPTLMSWLERHDLETYQRILEADRVSCDRNNGHGNAIAQAYNHIILPLANHRDKVTQVRWGIADFKRRFGRDPEGIWLAETAVDNASLEVLISEDIQFIVLAPSQAERCRQFGLANGFDEWQSVSKGEIDSTRPYRCFLPTQANGRNAIDIFFYDGPISGDMGYSDILLSSEHFADRLSQAVRLEENGEERKNPSQLISVATDGETFGHHRSGAEKALCYALTEEFARRGWQTTSYAHYLSLRPPTWEVQLKPATAWSCSHGVERWRSDCGCGGGGGWQQQWRGPLRNALDWLRDRLSIIFEQQGATLFKDAWEARNGYVAVIGDRSAASLDRFFEQYQSYELNQRERTQALQLLEMQRHALLMYTSCGWFFDEISRPEGTQILRYAARAIELAEVLDNTDLEIDFVRQLAQAPSNVDYFKDGAGVYCKQVKPAQVSIEQVVAQYAMGSLFDTYRSESPLAQPLYCYLVERLDYYQQPLGAMTLAVGQVRVTAKMTQEQTTLAFAVLHLGGQDFHCGIQTFSSRAAYSDAKTAVTAAFATASIAQSVMAVTEQFGQTYTLQDIFAEERHRIMQQLNQETLERLDQLYEQVYRENYGVLMAFHRDRLPVPQSLQVAADTTLSQRAMKIVQSLEQDLAEPDGNLLKIATGRIAELEGIAIEAHHFRCALKLSAAKPILERLINQVLVQTLQLAEDTKQYELAMAVEGIDRLIGLGDSLGLPLALHKVQEHFYAYLLTIKTQPKTEQIKLQQDLFARLGQSLVMDAEGILQSHLPSSP